MIRNIMCIGPTELQPVLGEQWCGTRLKLLHLKHCVGLFVEYWEGQEVRSRRVNLKN